MMYPIFSVISLVGFMFFAGHAIVEIFPKTGVRYNCDIAEISPDMPIEAKNKCRELRRINNEKRNIEGDSPTSGR
jgi:hypothetical protein